MKYVYIYLSIMNQGWGGGEGIKWARENLKRNHDNVKNHIAIYYSIILCVEISCFKNSAEIIGFECYSIHCLVPCGFCSAVLLSFQRHNAGSTSVRFTSFTLKYLGIFKNLKTYIYINHYLSYIEMWDNNINISLHVQTVLDLTRGPYIWATCPQYK